MSFPYIIKTAYEPMSSDTAMVFGFLLIAVPIAWCFGYNWIRNELKRVDAAVVVHDEFVKATSETLAKVQTDIEVLKVSMQGQSADMHEIKNAIDEINKTMWTQLVK